MERAETVFEQVLDLAMGDRAAFLDRECAGDSALRERVQKLVDAHERAECLEFLQANRIPVPTEKLGDRIDRYKLLEKIGEGGCGVVYVAEQSEPVRRRVALKVIKLGMDTKAVVARFEAERQALAMMDHPNIAKVLDAGSTDTGRPFFVMELVRGRRITDYCDEANLSTSERLDLFIKVCQAIQHAHQKGIIHRDIKPSNILVTLHDGVPVPKVIDFGIAKATEGRLTDGTVYTQLHQFIGTPAYMSPEQAEMSGLDIDTRSDIYSLGVLLYELLTGKTPFDSHELMASGIDAMRKTIREKEPVRPSTQLTQELVAADVRRLKSSAGGETTSEEEVRASSRRLLQIKELVHLLKGDLDWVVMKCLEKDRGRRYETANGLAADLQRYRTNEPVVARPPTPLYRFQKMVRRNKFAFAAASAVAAALLVGLCFASWQAIRAINAERKTRLAQQAEQTQAEQARGDRDRAVRAEAESRLAAYAAEINVAFHALAENNLGRARELLDRQRPKPGEEDLRGFEWRHLWRLCYPGDELETFRDEGAVATAFSPDGKLLAYSDGKIIVRETSAWKVRATLPSPATTLSFAPHTNLLASGHDSGVEIWNTETWTQVRSLPATNHTARFSPDGRWLLTGTAHGHQLWNTQTWQPVAECSGLARLPWHARNTVAFSPDGQFLITSAAEDSPAGDYLRVWQLPGLEALAPFRFKGELPGSLAFSMDGKHLMLGLWDGQLAVWDFATRDASAERKEHTSWVTAVAMAPDGKTFATSSADQTVNLWDATTFGHLLRLRGHVRPLRSMAISPDGRTVASGSADGTTKLWSTDTRRRDTLSAGASVIAGFIDGGRRVVAATNNSWRVWTPKTGELVNFPISTSPQFVTDDAGVPGQHYAVKPDEPLGVLGRSDGLVEVWNLTTGAWVTRWTAHGEGISTLAFSSDGKQLATSSATGEVRVWDFTSKRETARFGPVDRLLLCVAFSPDGNTLAVSGESDRVWLWDLSTRREIRLDGHGDHVASVAFSPNGKLLATTTFSANESRLWELPSGNPVGALKGHVIGTTAVAFSPDGKTLATASLDRKLKLWNVLTRQELATFPLANRYPTLRFSADGRTLATGSGIDLIGQIQVLSAPSFDEIAAAEEVRGKNSRN